MPKTLLVTLAVLAVAVGTAATWASAGARQPATTVDTDAARWQA